MTPRVALLWLVAACNDPTSTSLPALPPPTAPSTPLAIVDVTVVPMDAERLIEHQTVLVRDGRIEWVGPVGDRAIPGDATVIEGEGRFLMPALTDMHVHMRRSEAGIYVRHGIATVRNMWGYSTLSRLMSDIASGVVIGPTIHSASPGVDGSPPQWPETVETTSLSQVAPNVQPLDDAGYRWIKIYSRLQPPVFDSVMRFAKSLGMMPIGHVPLAVDLRHALAAGMRGIEHFTGYDRALSATGRAGTIGWADAVPARFCRVRAALGEHRGVEPSDARHLCTPGRSAARRQHARCDRA